MKLKGINPFEKHVEKIVFGVMLLFALAMLVLQFVREPNQVEVERQSVRPDTVMDVVRDKAVSIRAKLESEQVAPQIAAYEAPDIQASFPGESVVPRDAIVALGPADVQGDDRIVPVGPTTVIEGATYAQFGPPAPTSPLAYHFGGTVDPVVVRSLLEEFPEIAAYFPAQQPYDKHATTVQATFDAAALRAALAAAPDDPDLTAIPAGWWENNLTILSVEMSRQTMRADGTWGPEEIIDVLPGRIDLKGEFLDDDFRPAMFPTLVSDARANQREIRQPEYYPMISGNNWIWPEQAQTLLASAEDENAEVQQDLRRLRYVDAKIERLERELAALRGGGNRPGPGSDTGGDRDRGRDGGGRAPRDDGRRPPRDDDRRGDAGDLPGAWPEIPDTWLAQLGGGGPDPGRDDGEEERRQREEERRQERIALIEGQLADLRAEREEIIARLNALGVDPAGEPLVDPFDAIFTEAVAPVSSVESEEITLWAHDITGEPGGVYRYRLRAWITNPFYGNVKFLKDEQADLAASPATPTPWSDWTESVRQDAEQYYFVTSATAPSESTVATSTRARVELFEFHYGYWRTAVLRLEPGDLLAGQAALPPLPVFEIEPDGTGEFVLMAQAEDEQELLPPTMPIRRDGFLMTVSRAPGDDLVQAYLRDVGGRLERRIPGRDASSALYDRLVASAVTGETAEVLTPGTGARRASSLPEAPVKLPGQLPGPEDTGTRPPDGNLPPPPKF